MKRVWVPQVIAATMLLWALVPSNPYGYYILLRWICFGIFGYLTYLSFNQSKDGWAWLLGVNIVIYNPIFRVHLDRELWSIINVISILILLASISIIKTDNEEHDEEAK